MPERAPPDLAPSRRRKAHPRYVLVGLAATLHRSGQAYPCTVRNISSDGLMASLYQADLEPGPVTIDFQATQPIGGTVLWARDWHLGLSFDQPIDVEKLLACAAETNAQPDRRSDQRFAVDCAAKLRVDGRYYFGRIADISCSGARFQTSGRLKRLGSTLLSAPDLPPLPCAIRWEKNGEFGLQFEERMPINAFEKWLASRFSTSLDAPAQG